MSTGIWIGATNAFQQRVAQREHLATEIAFLEGAFGEKKQLKTAREAVVLGRFAIEICWFFLVEKIALPETKPPETSKAGR